MTEQTDKTETGARKGPRAVQIVLGVIAVLVGLLMMADGIRTLFGAG